MTSAIAGCWSMWADLGEILASVLHRLETLDFRLVAVAVALQLANVALRCTAWWGVLRAAYPGRRVPLVRVALRLRRRHGGERAAPGARRRRRQGGAGQDEHRGPASPRSPATMLVTALFDGVLGVLAMTVAWARAAPPGRSLSHVPDLLARRSGRAGRVAVALVLGAASRTRLRRLLAELRQGGAILQTPRRYLTEVALPQAGAWACRLGVIFALLHAFHIAASPVSPWPSLVLGGVSSAVPVLPGGAGAQQVMVVYALRASATAGAALSFSLGMQVGITVCNALLGIAALTVLFRTLRPFAALRASRALVLRDA